MSILCVRLLIARKRKRMYQSDTGEKLNVTHNQVSNWETGKTIPNALQLKALADIYEVSTDWLLGRE